MEQPTASEDSMLIDEELFALLDSTDWACSDVPAAMRMAAVHQCVPSAPWVFQSQEQQHHRHPSLQNNGLGAPAKATAALRNAGHTEAERRAKRALLQQQAVLVRRLQICEADYKAAYAAMQQHQQCSSQSQQPRGRSVCQVHCWAP